MGNEAPAAPLLFLKPTTAVIGPGDPIGCRSSPAQVDYEGELAVVIGALVPGTCRATGRWTPSSATPSPTT